MPTLRRTVYTTAVDIAVSSMNLIIGDEDKDDVWVTYLESGVKFHSWSGAEGATVVPSQIGCGQSYDVTFYYYVDRTRVVKEASFDIEHVIKMANAINEWIQNGRI